MSMGQRYMPRHGHMVTTWPETERTDTASAAAGRLHVAVHWVQRSLRAQATHTVSLPCRIKRAQLAAWARNITLPAMTSADCQNMYQCPSI